MGGCADDKPTPSSSAKPDDKGKDKKPDFRAGVGDHRQRLALKHQPAETSGVEWVGVSLVPNGVL
jgi:hypothetical protein